MIIGFSVFMDISIVRIASAQLASDTPPQSSPQRVLTFNIPSQPLFAALRQFAEETQTELFYDNNVIAGRRSAVVRGAFTPVQAMTILLKGTGLMSQSFDPGTITILQPTTSQPDDGVDQIRDRTAKYLSYLALVQESLKDAICRNQIVGTDTVQIFAQLWVDSSGSIVRVSLLTPTGNGIRDQAYSDVLQMLDIGEAPPVDMPQPITLLIEPRTTLAAAGCPSSSGQTPQPWSMPND